MMKTRHPFRVGDYILDSPPYEQGKEFLHRPKAIRQKYREEASIKIIQHIHASEGWTRSAEMDDEVIQITVSRSGRILNIKAVGAHGHAAATTKAFASLIQAIRATKFNPVPDNYLEDDLTFNFDLACLSADRSGFFDATNDYGSKDSDTDTSTSKISSQLWWSSLPAVPDNPLFAPGPVPAQTLPLDDLKKAHPSADPEKGEVFRNGRPGALDQGHAHVRQR